MGMASHVKNLTKRNNTSVATSAKITIRRNVLDVIGADRAQVFDAYAGDGHMYRGVWSSAAGYIGCDLKFYSDDRKAFVADNRRVLRTIDLAPFNLFDLDAYGSPWEQLCIIAARRRLAAGESFGLVLTEGDGLKLKMGGMPIALSQLAGVRDKMPGLATAQSDIINRAIARIATMMGGTVTRRWEAVGKTGSAMRYIGLVLLGD